MKVAHIHLENFKRFKTLDIPVQNSLTEDIADQLLILGDNGTGKTTVLQAVALCLFLAGNATKKVNNFNWLGWLPDRYARWGYPLIELEVHFSPEENEATSHVAQLWSENGPELKKPFASPGNAETVKLRLKGERFDNTKEELFQFGGRSYAASLVAHGNYEARQFFSRLPGIFWFDQFRNLFNSKSADNPLDGRVTLLGIGGLRTFLNKWLIGRLDQNAPNYLKELEELYKKVFPDRAFSGPEAMNNYGAPTPDDYYFMISDSISGRTYDIEEMSAGEQAVFPILYEFVRQQIKYSVVLIDEIDLNLHPPLAQRLLYLLPQMGTHCQFFYTTHSEVISSVVSPAEIYRLPGGSLCL